MFAQRGQSNSKARGQIWPRPVARVAQAVGCRIPLEEQGLYSCRLLTGIPRCRSPSGGRLTSVWGRIGSGHFPLLSVWSNRPSESLNSSKIERRNLEHLHSRSCSLDLSDANDRQSKRAIEQESDSYRSSRNDVWQNHNCIAHCGFPNYPI